MRLRSEPQPAESSGASGASAVTVPSSMHRLQQGARLEEDDANEKVLLRDLAFYTYFFVCVKEALSYQNFSFTKGKLQMLMKDRLSCKLPKFPTKINNSKGVNMARGSAFITY